MTWRCESNRACEEPDVYRRPCFLVSLARAPRLRVPVSQLSTALVTHPPSISNPSSSRRPSRPGAAWRAHAAGDPLITVVGVGGAGGNAIDNMIREGDFPRSIEFVAANTDSQALAKSLAPGKLQLGPALTSGLGTGARPDLGRQSAEESLKQLTEHLRARDVLHHRRDGRRHRRARRR